MALIDDVKLALRINSSTHNTEINDLISAATADLALAGIKEWLRLRQVSK